MDAVLTQSLMILGWVSAFFGAAAYLLASRGTWDAKSLRFNLTNVTAAGLMVVVAGANGLWPSVAANLVWVVIGTQALIAIYGQRRAAARAAREEAEAAAIANAEAVLAQAAFDDFAHELTALTLELPLVSPDVALDFGTASEVPAAA
ncbi:hypothetical protein GCM10025865_14530 [Paraoerskovia sediminicola]|uniref:CBU-0592-like domain-containing protein n=1 Tax=Paraoerskovia sediminicola TaxID=1138587 RepID=A0ABN6XBC5_9CELL|nr:hypothetical protein [Paraoerskovia sediminicola]BDZ42154.1 hypothetical protein GCM10025865_14530 [Paraoerskovia sediminicola]